MVESGFLATSTILPAFKKQLCSIGNEWKQASYVLPDLRSLVGIALASHLRSVGFKSC